MVQNEFRLHDRGVPGKFVHCSVVAKLVMITQLSSLLRLLAESKRYEELRRKYLEKAAREFFRYIFSFGSNSPKLPSLEAAQSLEESIQAVRPQLLMSGTIFQDIRLVQ